MIFGGWIYGAVKDAIHDAIPSAIQNALGWHPATRVVEKEVTIKMRDGFEAIPGKIKVRVMTENDVPQLSETKIVPRYKEVTKVVRKTYFDRTRFNPMTGEHDYKKDESPLVEVLDIP